MAHTHNSAALRDYLKDVHTGKMLIPKFQRDFVWDSSKMIDLISSLLKGYPIGSFLLMDNTGEYGGELINGVATSNKLQDTNNEKLILDGQQRTTTMYQVFYGKGIYKFYFNIKSFIQIVLSTDNKNIEQIFEEQMEDWIISQELTKEPANNPSAQRAMGLFPFSIILNDDPISASEWLSIYCSDSSIDSDGKFNSKRMAELSRGASIFNKLIENITGFQVNLITINKGTSPNVVCSIFETLNSSGEELTVLDLLNAKCFSSGFYLREELDAAFDKYPIYNDFNDKKDSVGLAIVKTIGLLAESKACSKSSLLRLNSIEIINKWNMACQYINDALIYVKTNYGVLGIEYFPYKDMLPAIAVIIHDDKFNNDSNGKKNSINGIGSRSFWAVLTTHQIVKHY